MTPLAALFQALEAAGIGVDVEAARDAVWLAARLAAGAGDGASAHLPSGTTTATTTPADEETAARAAGVPTASGAEHDAEKSTGSATRPDLDRAAVPPGGSTPTLTRVRMARAAGLAGERGIPAALRPLRRKRRASSAPIDEIETVRRATEDDLWLPAYQLTADRWLELALVVDHGVSMSVWQPLAADLRRVFGRAAAFRDVRAWSLSSDGETIGVRPISSRQTGPAATPGVRSPFGGGRRGLVLVMTDCVSSGWHDGSVLTLLHSWSRQAPVAILQVLPERLWPRTALAEATRVTLRAVASATANPRLHWAAQLPLPEAGWRSRGVGVPPHLALFPVVGAAPSSLRRLARMVAGVSDESLDGVMFDMAAMAPLPPPPDTLPDDRVRRFWSVSSSGASELASLLSAVPVPSTRMLGVLRRELLPAADASVEAELLFSGLVSVPRDADAASGDVRLEFQPGVGAVLLENAPVDRVLDVLRRVAATAAIPGISSQSFESWIADPSAGEARLHPGSDSGAAHVAAVLGRIGGSYARLVHPTARPSPAQAPRPDEGPRQARTEPAVAREEAPKASPDVAQTARVRKRRCFVVMGFGTKTDYASGRSFDLDKSYRLLIQPAVVEAGFECIRGDELMHTGTIEKPLFEHLLDAELVVADLSTANANAIYELGVRHGLRPAATIVMAERQFRFPFDVGHTVIRPYDHLGSGIDAEEVERVRHELRSAIAALSARPPVDSPVYSFLPGLVPPGTWPAAAARPRGTDRPTCYVTMGYGEKTDFATARRLDLDKTYRTIIKPAAERAGLACVRADEIVHSGVIDKPLFDHLLEADVVVADLSTSNANALYELGIRHALRPSGTIVMAERQFRFPFDIASIAILSYEHLGSGIDYEEAERASRQLTERIVHAMAASAVDSPVYVFLRGLQPPTLPTAAGEEGEEPGELGRRSEASTVMELLREAQSGSDWRLAEQHARRLVDLLPTDDHARQQLAVAAYKSKQPDALSALGRAKEVLLALHPHDTRDVETLGLWAIVHKRLWELSAHRADLDEAIASYQRAFEIKGDHYNGINLAFLLTLRGVERDREASQAEQAAADGAADAGEAYRVRRRVIEICTAWLQEAEASRRSPEERFWVKATLAEALLGVGELERAEEMLHALRAESPQPWMAESVTTQFGKLKELLTRSRHPPR